MITIYLLNTAYKHHLMHKKSNLFFNKFCVSCQFFLNNSVRVCPIKLKFDMVHRISNTFWNFIFCHCAFNGIPDDVICNIVIYVDDTTLYSRYDQASDIWQQLQLPSELWIWSMRHCGLSGRKCLVDLNAGKTQLVSFDWSNNTGAIDVKMCGSVLVEKLSFKMLGLTFSSKLDWDSYIIFIAKTASKKIGALIFSIKFLSPEGALYLYKSTIWPCMEYCSHVRAGAPICYMELLDRLKNLFLPLLSLLHPWFIVEM